MKLAKRSVLIAAAVLCATALQGQGPYVSSVLSYIPAPGQHINDPAAGTPEVARGICGAIGSPVSLGAFGGYIVLGFDHTVMNDPQNPYGVDFTVFGNAFPGSAEPGIVYVMKDENGNGLPDDRWYELAGSRYFAGSTLPGYHISYYNTAGSPAGDIPWIDNLGDSGYVRHNEFHSQPYYPAGEYFSDINPDSLSFYGSRLYLTVKADQGMLKTPSLLFGYADTHPANNPAAGTGPDNPYTPGILEGTGGDAFDISWAVDENGSYVELAGIDFIRIQTAVNAGAGPLGEISTDVAGVADVEPNPGLNGETRLISLEKIPDILPANATLTMDPLYFEKGHPAKADIILASSDHSISVPGENHEITTLEGGEFILTASLVSDSSVKNEKLIRVVRPSSLKIDKRFGFLLSGRSGTVDYAILDQDGKKIDGMTATVTPMDTSVVRVTGIYPGQVDVTAVKPGKTSLIFSIPGHESLQQTIDVEVTEDLDPVGVSVSIQMDGKSLLSRQHYQVKNEDINTWIENNAGGNLVQPVGYVSVADVLASVFRSNGFTGNGNVFRFRKDSYTGNKLYLWQVGKDWEYVYGWGGNLDSEPYRQCWIVMVNDTFYLNDLEHVRVRNGDVVTVMHVGDILAGWQVLSIVPGRYRIDPPDTVSLSWNLFDCRLTDTGETIMTAGTLPSSVYVYVNDTSSGTLADMAGDSDRDIIFSPEVAGRYDIRIEGFPGEVATILAGDLTNSGSSFQQGLSVYPNPFIENFTVSNPGGRPCTYMLTDISGRLLLQGFWDGNGKLVVPASELRSGTYILSLTFREGNNVNRVLIKP